MRLFSLLGVVILVLLGVTFSCLNAQPVLINYYVGTHSFPLSLVIVFSLASGVLLGLVIGLSAYLMAKAELARLQRHLRLVEKEVSHLRTLPLR